MPSESYSEGCTTFFCAKRNKEIMTSEKQVIEVAKKYIPANIKGDKEASEEFIRGFLSIWNLLYSG